MPVKSLNAFTEGAEWPPPSEKARLKRYAENRILWQAREDRLTIRLGKTYVPALEEAQKFILDLYSLLTDVWVKALFGEPPAWSAGEDEDSKEHKDLSALATRVAFNRVGKEVAQDRSIFGDGVFTIAMEGGKATINPQPPHHWFPVVSPNNIRRVTAHVLADVIEQGSVGAKQRYLVLEIHERGRIQHRVHRLTNAVANTEGGKIGPRVSLTSILPEIAARVGVGDAGLERTGVDNDFLIAHVANDRLSDELYGMSDYSRIDTTVNGLEERLDQINDILRKHAEPMLYGPQIAMYQDVNGVWRFNSQDKYIAMIDKDDPVPGYITWDGKLDDALANFNLLMEQFYLQTRTTPAAFGQLKGGLAESGSALRRLMLPVLQRAALIQQDLDPEMKRVLTIAGKLERLEFGEISSEWFDGLPPDEFETAQSVSLYRAAGVMSRYQAVKAQHNDWRDKQIKAEIERIDDDEAVTAGAGGGLIPAGLDPVNGGNADE